MSPGVLLCAVAAGVGAASFAATWGPVPGAATGVLVFLSVVTTWTDLRVARIPLETCWLAAGVGVVLSVAALWAGQVVWSPQRLAAAALCAGLLCAAAGSWWFGRGGLGDVRLLLACGSLAWWWLDLLGLLAGSVAAVAVVVGVAALTRVASAPAQSAAAGPLSAGWGFVPAGPAYVSVFVVAALVTAGSRVAA